VGDLDLYDAVYRLSAIPPPYSSSRAAPCIPDGILPANGVVNGDGSNWRHIAYRDWQPRVGIAFRLRYTKTVQAGYGLNHHPHFPHDRWCNQTFMQFVYAGSMNFRRWFAAVPARVIVLPSSPVAARSRDALDASGQPDDSSTAARGARGKDG
jgi:hypothetical protein